MVVVVVMCSYRLMKRDDDNGDAAGETQVVTTTITMGDNNGIKSCLLLSYADLRSCQSRVQLSAMMMM